MITIQKQEVANWLLLEYLATFHNVHEKLRFFEHKYYQSYHTFEQKMKTAVKEDFDQWDDYIEWKAYTKLAEEIESKIEAVKHGHFEITES